MRKRDEVKLTMFPTFSRLNSMSVYRADIIDKITRWYRELFINRSQRCGWFCDVSVARVRPVGAGAGGHNAHTHSVRATHRTYPSFFIK